MLGHTCDLCSREAGDTRTCELEASLGYLGYTVRHCLKGGVRELKREEPETGGNRTSLCSWDWNTTKAKNSINLKLDMYQRMYVFYTMNSKLLMGKEKLNQGQLPTEEFAKDGVLIWLRQPQQNVIDQVA